MSKHSKTPKSKKSPGLDKLRSEIEEALKGRTPSASSPAAPITPTQAANTILDFMAQNPEQTSVAERSLTLEGTSKPAKKSPYAGEPSKFDLGASLGDNREEEEENPDKPGDSKSEPGESSGEEDQTESPQKEARATASETRGPARDESSPDEKFEDSKTGDLGDIETETPPPEFMRGTLTKDEIGSLELIMVREVPDLTRAEIRAHLFSMFRSEKPFDYWDGFIHGLKSAKASQNAKVCSNLLGGVGEIMDQHMRVLKSQVDLVNSLDEMYQTSRKELELGNKSAVALCARMEEMLDKLPSFSIAQKLASAPASKPPTPSPTPGPSKGAPPKTKTTETDAPPKKKTATSKPAKKTPPNPPVLEHASIFNIPPNDELILKAYAMGKTKADVQAYRNRLGKEYGPIGLHYHLTHGVSLDVIEKMCKEEIRAVAPFLKDKTILK